MTDGVDIVYVVDASRVALAECFQDQLHAVFVIGDLLFDFVAERHLPGASAWNGLRRSVPRHLEPVTRRPGIR